MSDLFKRIQDSLRPGHGWVLQSWYSTGAPLQANGVLLPSGVAQERLRVRKPLEHSLEQADHVSHDDQAAPWTRVTGRPILNKSSTRPIQI